MTIIADGRSKQSIIRIANSKNNGTGKSANEMLIVTFIVFVVRMMFRRPDDAFLRGNRSDV